MTIIHHARICLLTKERRGCRAHSVALFCVRTHDFLWADVIFAYLQCQIFRSAGHVSILNRNNQILRRTFSRFGLNSLGKCIAESNWRHNLIYERHWHIGSHTPAETSIAPEKMVGKLLSWRRQWRERGRETTFLLGRPIFRGYVSFTEGTSLLGDLA